MVLQIPSSTPTVIAAYHPRNYTEAILTGFKGIIEPDNPTVLQKLHTLCPTIDEGHFTANLLAVYRYAMLIQYAFDSTIYGSDYWQTSEDTIQLGHGDCEDQAINLATLIEALYKQTYGYIPLNLVWVVIGYVKTTGVEGGHGWVLLNEGLLPKETVDEIKSVSISLAVISVVLGGTSNEPNSTNETEVNLDLNALSSKNNRELAIFYIGEKYFELEPTWNLPISEFSVKKYPYTQVYAIFNSQKYEPNPSFYPVEQTPAGGAEIRNIAFPNKVTVGSAFTLNITVQNYECGYIGADLVVILKKDGVEVTRQNTFVFKYIWQIHTFVFPFSAIEPTGDRSISAELYFNDWGVLKLVDFKNFTVVISNIVRLAPITNTDYDGLWRTSDFRIMLTSLDDTGVYATYYRINNGSTKSVSTNGQPQITTEGATNTLEYWSIDNEGIEELPHKTLSQIKLDKTAPIGVIHVNNDANYTNSTALTLLLGAVDNLSGVSKVRFSTDGVWDTEQWESFVPVKTVSIPSGDGNKTMYYQIKDSAGLITTYTESIILDTTKPVANAGQSQTINVGATATLNGSGSADNTGIISYLWDFGDGATGSGTTTTHAYTHAGTYTAKLTVADGAGNTATSAVSITVQEVIPEFTPFTYLVLAVLTALFAVVAKSKIQPKSKLH